VDAFDADVIIYAAEPEHELGRRVAALFQEPSEGSSVAKVGSVLLLPEVLTKPQRLGALDEVRALSELLGRLELLAMDVAIAEFATALGAKHRLRASDAVHFATAVYAGADRFITNNRRDFPKSIGEIDVTYPEDLLTT